MAAPSVRSIGRVASGAVILTIGLVTYGAWVRVSGSGLGCPDWPLCHGQVLPVDRASTIESGHRWFAGGTMITVFGAAVLGGMSRREVPTARWLLVLSALLIFLQALLGAAVVLTELHPLVRLVHLGLAMAIIATLTVVAVFLAGGEDVRLILSRPSWYLLPLATGTVLVGGSLVATATSFECSALPLCDTGSSTLATALHGTHRVLGVLTMVGAILLALSQRGAHGQQRGLFWAAVLISALLGAQVLVGAVAVPLGLPAGLRVLHVGLASCIWAGLVALSALATRAHNQIAPHA